MLERTRHVPFPQHPGHACAQAHKVTDGATAGRVLLQLLQQEG